jgi:hypothetical protein
VKHNRTPTLIAGFKKAKGLSINSLREAAVLYLKSKAETIELLDRQLIYL